MRRLEYFDTTSNNNNRKILAEFWQIFLQAESATARVQSLFRYKVQLLNCVHISDSPA